MAELDAKDRKKLGRRTFAYVDRNGEGQLPLDDRIARRSSGPRAAARRNVEKAQAARHRRQLHSVERIGRHPPSFGP